MDVMVDAQLHLVASASVVLWVHPVAPCAGDLLVSVGAPPDACICLYSMRAGELLCKHALEDEVCALSISADNKQIATASHQSVVFWDIAHARSRKVCLTDDDRL